jgi:hypothetical protein
MNAFSRRAVSALAVLLLAVALQSCETLQSENSIRREQMNAAIRQEAPGNYFIGRRFYKTDYKMWGWVRQSGQPWSTAKLVMLNEQKTLAPDRQQGRLGTDNNFEYRLTGYFSGDTVYEPASDGFYPEFVLVGYEIRDTNPPLIFADPRETKPEVRLLAPPI